MSGSAKRVLIADDSKIVRSALRLFLEENTNVVVCGEAADGTEAIRKVKELNPDLILLDLAMPNMSGIDAARMIRKISPQTQIIVFTLYSDLLNEVTAKTLGLDRVVSKAEGPPALMKALQPFLTADDTKFLH
jgi:DNA-binding NarL/FixJ family response regulator